MRLKEEAFSKDDIESLPVSNLILLAKQWIASHKR